MTVIILWLILILIIFAFEECRVQSFILLNIQFVAQTFLYNQRMRI